MSKKVRDLEYQFICERMKCDTEMRNTLLTFTFTAVIAILGFGFATEKEVNQIVYLLPFFIIVPFTGRVSYYRKWSAHMAAYLDVFAPKLRTYTDYGKKVKIENNCIDKLLAWFVNYELFILACASTILFEVKYPKKIDSFEIFDWAYCLLPILFSCIVLVLIKSVRNYEGMKEKYKEEFYNKRM